MGNHQAIIRHALVILVFISLNVVNQFVAGDPFREGKLVVFLLTALLAGSWWVARRYDPWIALLIVIASLEWAWATGPLYGILPTAGVLGFLYLAHVAASDRWLMMVILRATTWLQVVFSIIQAFKVQTFGSDDPYFIGLILGNFGHPSIVGAWFAACAPLAFFYWSRVEFVICVALAIYSGSTMAILALMAGCFYVCARMLPALWLLAIPGVVALGLGAYFLPQIEFFSLSGRMLPWKVAYEWILKSPWVGYGPGSWDGLYDCKHIGNGLFDCTTNHWGVDYKDRWNFLHNDFLQLAFECGLPALAVAVLSVYSVLRKVALPFGAVIAALLVNSTGWFTLHLPPLAFLFVVAMALGIGDNKGHPKPTTEDL